MPTESQLERVRKECEKGMIGDIVSENQWQMIEVLKKQIAFQKETITDLYIAVGERDGEIDHLKNLLSENGIKL